jgi:hypothetical protein
MKRWQLTTISALGLGLAAAGLALGWRWAVGRHGPPAPPPGSVAIVDVQNLRLLYEPGPTRPAPAAPTLVTDVLVAGGGLGGVAAALGACERGYHVVLTEETDWLGGQISSQGVAAPDDHRYIETFGGTRLYYELRSRIRNWYQERYQLSALGLKSTTFSPGRGWVSHLTFEPRAGASVVTEMLQPYVDQGLLQIRYRHKPVRAEVADSRVQAVTFRNLDGENHTRVAARYVLDATEMGDLLPLTGAVYRAGAEGHGETAEPKARRGAHRIDCAQSFAYPFALELERAPAPPIAAPARYEEFRQRQPYTFAHNDGSRHPPSFQMFGPGIHAGGPFWTYRRALAAENFDDAAAVNDRSVILFAGNDYHWGWLVDQPAERMLATLKEAKALARGYAYWLQNDAPRDEGGFGYPELRLRPDVMGSEDGFAKYPYVREGRRLVALRLIREQDIGRRYQPTSRAALFPDTVGVGWHGIDLHPGACGEALAAQPTRPFQIPLGALIPKHLENLLPACKNIGTTHITNGAYRMHPTEWNIGESAGRLAAFCLENDLTPRQVATGRRPLRRFQAQLVAWGVPIFWFVDTPLKHPAFAASQLLAAWGMWPVDQKHLQFGPDLWLTGFQAESMLQSAGMDLATSARILAAAGLEVPDATATQTDFAREWLAEVYPGEE